METNSQTIVVTGANGLVGAATCAALSQRGVNVRAIVRRPDTAPKLPGVHEVVGEFQNLDFTAQACQDVDAVVNTVHPMKDDDLQAESAAWAEALARTAKDAGVDRFVQVSTTSVYERVEGTGDIDEDSKLVDDDADDYSVTKRQTEDGINRVEGLTRIVVRPTAVLGAGPSSIWNTRRPAAMAEDVDARTDDPDRTFGWVHINDLATLIADAATGAIPFSDDPSKGPVEGEATPVNAVSGNVPMRLYVEPVCRALGVEPVWQAKPAFRAELGNQRAIAWGWVPQVGFDDAMAELVEGLA